ncbi:MAG: signal peptidase II [Candidatus Izimaplasma sp.]|nr:signal peptidase II [Candidatus Izimaplasma bacterium]
MQKHKTSIIISATLFLVFIDQLTKKIVENTFELYEQRVIIKGFLTFTKLYNDGGFGNLFGGQMVFFYVISAFAGLLMFYLIKQIDFNKSNWFGFGVILMMSGGIGNLIDRIIYQHVVDFLDVDIFSYTTWPVFNVADIFLVIGMILFVIDLLFEEKIYGKKN